VTDNRETTGAGARGPALFVYAHPDDESFGAAGTIAALTDRGVSVTIVSATRGEAGEISDPALATPETLGEVRERELRAAMAVVGVTDIRFLDYRDSGMAGTPENDDPRAFVQAPEGEVVDRLLRLIRDLGPETVVTFGPEGIYGHPDHRYAHRVARAAVLAAADPRVGSDTGKPWRVRGLSYNAVPRERIQRLAQRSNGPFRKLSPEEMAEMGTPRSEITTVVDVSDFRERKERAIRAHLTQVGEGGPMSDMPRDEVERILSREHFVRAPLPWDGGGAPPRDLLDDLAALYPAEPA